MLKKGGHFTTIAGDKQEPVTFGKIFKVAGQIINRKFWNIVAEAPAYDFVVAAAMGSQLQSITELIEKGAIMPSVSQVFPLDEVVAVLEASMTQRTRGKLAIAVVEEDSFSPSRKDEAETPAEGEGKDKDKETPEGGHDEEPKKEKEEL